MSNKKILLYHRIKSVQTIQDFIDREFINIKAKDLFNENKDFIFSQMSEKDKSAYKESNGNYPTSGSDLNVNMVLPCPCKLLIDPKYITAEVAINQTNLQVDDDDFYAFEEEKIQNILQEEPYSSNVDRRAPTCQVIGWFKTLYKMFLQKSGGRWTNQYDYIDSYLNISADVILINTNVGKNGGNFSIQLPFISMYSGESSIYRKMEDGWEAVDDTEYNSLRVEKWYAPTNSITKKLFGIPYFDRKNFNDDSDFYSTLFSSNDLLFISYNAEKFQYENGKWSANDVSEAVKSVEAGSYDMIGLVDEVKIVKNSQGAQIAIEVTGRDLMKLLIEDGSFFFNPSVVPYAENIFFNYDEVSARGDILSVNETLGSNGDVVINGLQRMVGARDITNLISIFARKQNMELSFILKGVISQLSNIQVVPGVAFSGFKNRTKFVDLQPKEE